MKKPFFKKNILSTSILVFSFLWILTSLNAANPALAGNDDIYKNLKLFNEALDLIEKNYVEAVDSKAVIEGAIKGMTRSLDPHSSFMTADMFKELQVDTKGVFGGLGIEITIQDDVITVVSPLEDTPAYLAGIQAQDQIIGIDGESTKGFTLFDAVQKLRGPKGTKVTITIMRKKFAKPKDFTITRDIIKILSVKYKIFSDSIGYIRIAQFQESTASEIKKALKTINVQNSLRGLIIDVRNNPGGLLDQAVKVSDVFLKKGDVVSTRGRIKTANNTYAAEDDGDEPLCPIVMLINGGSASASEILAGALRDNGRAILLGTQTFGKGSVQVVIPLDDGSALKLTTAKYYTPKGSSIQAKGIIPDIVVEYAKINNDNNSDKTTISEKDLKGHLKEEGKTGKPGETDVASLVQEDNQIQRAIDLIKSWEMFKKMNNG